MPLGWYTLSCRGSTLTKRVTEHRPDLPIHHCRFRMQDNKSIQNSQAIFKLSFKLSFISKITMQPEISVFIPAFLGGSTAASLWKLQCLSFIACFYPATALSLPRISKWFPKKGSIICTNRWGHWDTASRWYTASGCQDKSLISDLQNVVILLLIRQKCKWSILGVTIKIWFLKPL